MTRLEWAVIKEKKMTRPEWAVIKKMNWLDRQTGSQIMKMTRPERGGHKDGK
jgi:hypothetical protein